MSGYEIKHPVPVYSKEVITGTKVMLQTKMADGSLKSEYVRDIDHRDVVKFPHLKDLLNKPAVKTVIEEFKEKTVAEMREDLKQSVEPNKGVVVEQVVEEAKEMAKAIVKKGRKKAEEAELPEAKELEIENS